ncbi:hypothetical protein [Arenimonas oryziterrae]|nr:hypothetical protein [Arenimonas oryziterrae]
MISVRRYTRPVLVAFVALAMISATGCGWLKSRSNKNSYATSVENRPLEVPPDLDVPDTSGATALPAASLLGGPHSPANTGGFLVDGDTKAVWGRVGSALEGIDGATITGRAEAITSYDVSYREVNFLIRVEASGGQSRVSAISADGLPMTSGPAAELLTQVRGKL